MRALRVPRVLLATAVALSLVAIGALRAAHASHVAAPGTIVFASDRLKAEPGEIYALAPGLAARSVSRSLAADQGLAVAPAGRLIAFWSGRSGVFRIYLARSDGSHVRLVRGIPPAAHFSGGQLVFSAAGTQLFASLYPGSFVVDAGTASARNLGFCEYGAIVPSPDGRRIACGVRGRTVVYDLAGRQQLTFPGQGPIWSSRSWLTNRPNQGSSQQRASAPVYDSTGRLAGRVQGQPVGWSPDGRRLVFRRDRDLRVSDTDSIARSRLLMAGWDGGSLSFTPDGRYVSTGDPKGHPVLLPLAGGSPVAGLDYGLGAWSRDGRLAYADYAGVYPAGAGAKLGVYITDTHGHNPRLAGRFLYDDHGWAQLAWLPSGKRVLFGTSSECGGKGLFEVSATGGATRPLNGDQRNLESPTWSPDGMRIAFSATIFDCHLGAGSPIHLETVGADGSAGVRVTDEGGSEGSFDLEPAYSPDGSKLAFVHQTFDSSGLAWVPSAGGDRTPIQPTSPAEFRTDPAWSPDGSKIAYRAGSSLWTVAPSGGKPEYVGEIPGAGDETCGGAGIVWAPDGRSIAVGGHGGISLITPGSPVRARLAIRARCAEYPSFSPDGTQIAFDAQVSHALGSQTAIMVAHVDGSGLRTLSTVPFRQSVHPTWQPLP